MSWSLLLPAIIGVAMALVSGRLQRRLPPSHAAAAFTFLAAAGAVAVVAFVSVMAVIFLSGMPLVARLLPWCEAIGRQHELPAWIGLSASAAVAAMAASAARTLRRGHRHRDLVPDGDSIVVLATDEPTAFAVPGDPGCIVVSSGMLRALDGDERRVLFAHERAHLDHRHHRYLWVTGMAAAVVPALQPLQARVRFAAERWADEDAVEIVGDRQLVARAICRAALAQHAYPAGTMALAGVGVPARVDALLSDAPLRSPLRRAGLVATTASVLLAAFAASSVQIHHLATFARHLCPGI